MELFCMKQPSSMVWPQVKKKVKGATKKMNSQTLETVA